MTLRPFAHCVVATLLLSGCCTANLDRVVLLPDASGSVGKIAIIGNEGETILSKPFETVRTDDNGVLDSAQLSEEEVRRKYGSELSALPKRPTTFVVYFIGDSDQLTPESSAKFFRIAEEIRSRPAAELEVIGHTDTQGSLEYNDELSMKRAETVKTQLIAREIGISKITVSGRGERSLAVNTADGADEPRNRRVVISVR